MSVYTNQTNANPTTSFYALSGGGGGGSNFPQGITVGGGVGSVQIQSGNIPAGTGPPLGYVGQSSTGINTGWLANPLWVGDAAASYLKLTSTTIGLTDGNGSNEKNLVTADPTQIGSANPTFALNNISKVTGTLNTSAASPSYVPIDFILRPTNASQGGIIYQKLEWDAVDTGANYALILAATNSNALIASVWPGYISMPLTMTGASVSIESDNETFLFCDGKAGALGNISTGTPFLSGSNLFSSITSPDLASTANMDALLSTLKGTYPNCFA